MARRRDSSRSLDGKTPTETTPPRLPRPPAPGLTPPPVVKPPRLPPNSAKPGRRTDAPSDIQVTSRLERIMVEPTPAPLPPSPAAADAERWFEQVPTNPGAPNTTPPRMPSGQIAVPEHAHAAPPKSAPSWMFPVLLALTALTVGMVLGALLFGRSPDCPAAPATPTRSSLPR